MGEVDGNLVRLYIMTGITAIYFVVEIVVGYAVGSLALVSDAFHMLSDILSLIIGIMAMKFSKKKESTQNLTYGWARAEILGGLFNGIFLIALCFSIFVEAIQRFFEPKEITRPVMLLIVGSVGLGVNIFGLILFGGHAHSHGGGDHGHSHSHGESKKEKKKNKKNKHSHSHSHSLSHRNSDSGSHSHASSSNHEIQIHLTEDDALEQSHGDEHTHSNHHDHEHEHESHHDHHHESSSEEHGHHDHGHGHGHGDKSKKKKQSMTMHSVWLHVMGDALGSLGVIASSLFIWLTHYEWRYIVDPLVSIFITAIILRSAIPLVKHSTYILLQGVPHSISPSGIKEQILKIEEVLGIHEFHIWQLDEQKVVCSVHILCNPDASKDSEFMKIATNIKGILHDHGIHSSTIQPEFLPEKVSKTDLYNGNKCNLKCTSAECEELVCCSTDEQPSSTQDLASAPTTSATLTSSENHHHHHHDHEHDHDHEHHHHDHEHSHKHSHN